jgi:hypothetical protein
MRRLRPCNQRRPCSQPRARAPPVFVMLIRFTLPFLHHSSNRPVGVFRGSYWMYLEGRLHEREGALAHLPRQNL